MPKAKGKSRRHKYSYNLNRKRLYRSARRRAAPRIACSHIRHAWDPHKSVAQNLAEMGLAEDPNKAVPIPKKLLGMEVGSDGEQPGKKIVRKPYVVNGQCWAPPQPPGLLSSCAVPGLGKGVVSHPALWRSTSFPPCLSLQPPEGSCHRGMCWCLGPGWQEATEAVPGARAGQL
ncbi:nucleolar protein 16 isoform X3 [Passer montanus]|uniref:nucleolar protein 16 isoform X3 n=1 Tax=Passer montanus TaxID=9160 RepID=UPI00196226A3|nr:nucleolar protein 16 isoform X3 [Passer montanus]